MLFFYELIKLQTISFTQRVTDQNGAYHFATPHPPKKQKLLKRNMHDAVWNSHILQHSPLNMWPHTQHQQMKQNYSIKVSCFKKYNGPFILKHKSIFSPWARCWNALEIFVSELPETMW